MKNLREVVAKKASRVIAQVAAPAVPAPATPGVPAVPAPKPPAAAPAAPAPGIPGVKPKDQEAEAEAESDVKREKKKELKLEDIGEKLDKLSDTMNTLADALSDQKKMIEKSLDIEDPEHQDALKSLQDEDKDKLNDSKYSAEEFGVDPEKLVVSKKENGMSVKNLRNERKARLYSKVPKQEVKEAAKEELKPSETIREQFQEDKMKKKTFSPEAPKPEITKVKPSEVPEMYKIAMELNADGTQWTVLRAAEEGKEEPIYTIDKNDDPKFAEEEFANKIFEDAKVSGLEAALTKVNAKVFKAELMPPEKPGNPDKKVDEKKEKFEKKDEKKDEKDEKKHLFEKKDEKPGLHLDKKDEVKKDEAPAKPSFSPGDFKRRFSRAFRLALSAMQKNLLRNPLKGALYDTLVSQMNFDPSEATNVIEASFAKAAAEHFEVALTKAEDYMEMNDEAFVEAESTIGELDSKVPAVTASVQHRGDKALMERAANNSLPFSTATEEDLTDKLSILSSVLPKPKLLRNK